MALTTPRTWATNDPLNTTNLNTGIRDPILELQPLYARKTADESIANNTMQDDDELLVAVPASATFLVSLHLIYQAAATPLINIGWSAPAGATFDWTPDSLHNSVTAATRGDIERIAQTVGGTISLGAAGAGTSVVAKPSGVLIVAGTSGNFRFRWAQLVTNATATVVKAGSALTLQRVA